MCWQDIQIGRQQSRETTIQLSNAGITTFQLPANIRRTKLMITSKYTSDAGVAAPIITLYTGQAGTTNALFASQTLINSLIVDMRDYGSLLNEPIYMDSIITGGDDYITITAIQLYDPEDYGNPITHPPVV